MAVVHWPVAVLLALCTALLPLNLRLAGQATLTAGERQLAASRRLSAACTATLAPIMPTLRFGFSAFSASATVKRGASRNSEITIARVK